MGPQDHLRAARWQIARLIIFVDLALVLAPAFALYRLMTGASHVLTDDTVLLAAWAVAAAPLMASFVLAVRVFTAGARDVGWRSTAWASGLFLAGIAIIAIPSAIRYSD